MPNVLALKQQAVELNNEVAAKMKACDDGTITVAEFSQYMANAEKQDKEIADGIKAFNSASDLRKRAEPEGLPPEGGPAAPSAGGLRQKQVQRNWAAYKSLQKMAEENYRNVASGGNSVRQGSFSFDIALKHANDAGIILPEEEQLGQKAQGVAGLQGEFTSGTTAPPTGNLAQNVYFPGGTAGPAVEPQFIPGIAEMRWYPNVIASLFSSFPVSSPIVSYVKETAYNNNAAATPEGATKPTSNSGIARYAESVGKITNLERVTDELIQDANYFWSLIQRRGVMGVTRKEEIELLAGVGMPGINGLLNRNVPGNNLSYPSGFTLPTTVTPVANTVIGAAVGSGALSETVASITPGRKFTLPTDYTKGTAAAEALLQAITDIRVNWFFEPDAMILNPADWTTIRLAKDANGQYLGGSFFGTNYGLAQNAGNVGIEQGLTLWNKRAITTPVQPLGLPIVGDFQDAGYILRLGGLRVDVTNTNGFDFEQNLWTMRCEERVGLLIDRPELFEIIQFA